MTSTGGYLTWNIDPILVHLGPVALHWYGVCFALGVSLAYVIGRRLLEPDGVSREQIATCLYRRTAIAKRPGALLGTMLITIFTFRFLVEFIKEPQSPFEATMWLDLGQLLSIPAIAAGIFLVWWARRDAPAPARSVAASATP
jgi:prolipoprotein diacylglyceryltransferase